MDKVNNVLPQHEITENSDDEFEDSLCSIEPDPRNGIQQLKPSNDKNASHIKANSLDFNLKMSGQSNK